MSGKLRHLVNLGTEFGASSDVGWILKRRDFRLRNPARCPKELVECTLRSKSVGSALKTEARSLKEAEEILEEVAHDFRSGRLESVAFVVHKAMKRMFDSILISERSRLTEIRELCAHSPVVFVPTHRSYLDFLLVSYICFNCQIPPPVIAAATDFLGMRVVSGLMRNCGAFFIRRSEAKDPVYWAVFSAYLDALVTEGGRPLEFFVEGTRSRSGKHLRPKTGLLETVLDTVASGRVDDVCFVPVSISYSKIPEDVLFAYELLGKPKPPETTSGLWKARAVMKRSFGRVHVLFSAPISARALLSSRRQSNAEAAVCLAHDIIDAQKASTVVDIWAIACVCMNQLMMEKSNLQLTEVLGGLRKHLELTDRLGIPVHRSRESLSAELDSFFRIHRNLIEVDVEGSCRVSASFQSPATATEELLEPSEMGRALLRIVLANYANKCLFLYLDVSKLLVGFKGQTDAAVGDLRDSFVFLHRLFDSEFVSRPGVAGASFEEALTRLQASGILAVDGERVSIRSAENANVLRNLLQPILLAYWLYSVECQTKDAGTMDARGIQNRIADWLKTGRIPPFYEILSLEMINNAVRAFQQMEDSQIGETEAKLEQLLISKVQKFAKAKL